MNTHEIVVYEPNARANIGFFKSWALMIHRVVEAKELIWQLFKRDFFANYKQSFLGLFWIFISPVISIISWVFLNATGILQPGEVGTPYPVYVLVGGSMWGLFMSSYQATARSLYDSGSLIVQVNFPHDALVIKQAAQTVASFLINLVLILCVLAIYQIYPGWKIILFPLTMIPLFLFGTGIGMIVSVLFAVVHDFEKAVTAILGFTMYLTPVIYSPHFQNPYVQAFVTWNPLGHLISGPRDLILSGTIQNDSGFMVSSLFAFFFFLAAWRLFFLSEYKVAERL